MSSHAISVTCRRLTCGPKFVSVVFLSIWPIPRTPIPHSSPPSLNPSSAQRSCARGRGSVRQAAGAALLRTDVACGRGAPACADAACGRGGRKRLGAAACARGSCSARLPAVPLPRSCLCCSSVPPSPPIPHSPPPTQDPTRRPANPRIRARAAAYGGPFLSSLPESELRAADPKP
jgi:hypothetical protein